MSKPLIVVGYMVRYTGWKRGVWNFVHTYPGPLPEAHATRTIRKVYIDPNESATTQKTKPAKYSYKAYE